MQTHRFDGRKQPSHRTIRPSGGAAAGAALCLSCHPNPHPEGGAEQEQPVSVGANPRSHLPAPGPSDRLHSHVIRNQAGNLRKLEMHLRSPMCNNNNNNNNTVDDLLPGVFQFLLLFFFIWKQKTQNRPCCDLLSDSVKAAHTRLRLQYKN